MDNPKYCGECDHAKCYIHDVYCNKTKKVLKKKYLISNGVLCRPLECPLDIKREKPLFKFRGDDIDG